MTLTKHILGILALCFSAVSLDADTRVRSGEHATFTRLVLYFPGQVDTWNVLDAEDGYLVDITPSPRALDVTEVFAFIPRTRISDMELRDGRVWIGSSCDCHLSVFRARSDAIAIDIRDGPDPSQPTTPLPKTVAISPTVVPRFFDSRDSANGPQWQVQSQIEFVPPPDRTSGSIDSTAVAKAVARAASGGLLSTSKAGSGLDGPGVETRSALDAAASDRTARVHMELCRNLAQFDDVVSISPANAWTLVEGKGAQEAGSVPRGMAYLSLGFGAEAAAIFTASALPPDKAILFAQVAHFVDAPDQPAPRTISASMSCNGVPTLLAVLAAPPSEEIAENLGLEAVTTLSRLPYPLRAHLAPHLERRLQRAGLADLAQSARFASLRATHETDVPGQVAGTDVSRQSEARTALQQFSLPLTAFFNAPTSEPVYDAIVAARFTEADRILIEAWIKEAPSAAEADAATALYVAALNGAARPLHALSYLDTRFGRRGVVSPGLENAIAETLDTATSVLSPGELLVLGARLPERPWFNRLPAPSRTRFEATVGTIRAGITGVPSVGNSGFPVEQSGVATEIDLLPLPDQNLSPSAGQIVTASPRRVAAEAAILSATNSISRSVSLRAEATERTAEWARASSR